MGCRNGDGLLLRRACLCGKGRGLFRGEREGGRVGGIDSDAAQAQGYHVFKKRRLDVERCRVLADCRGLIVEVDFIIARAGGDFRKRKFKLVAVLAGEFERQRGGEVHGGHVERSHLGALAYPTLCAGKLVRLNKERRQHFHVFRHTGTEHRRSGRGGNARNVHSPLAHGRTFERGAREGVHGEVARAVGKGEGFARGKCSICGEVHAGSVLHAHEAVGKGCRCGGKLGCRRFHRLHGRRFCLFCAQ